MLFLGVVCVPVHVLGWTNTLTRDHLLYLSGSLSAVCLLFAWGPSSTRTLAWERTRATVLLPWSAILETVRARSVALIGLVACSVIFAWTAWLAYLAPSSSWDGLMYHEGIVGYAIQNHGFQWVDLPQGVHEQINGFPRTCEYLAIASALLDGKRFTDLVPTLTSPIAILAFYVWLRRFMQRRSAAIGFATGLFLVPAFVLELRSTYVDIGYAVCFAASCHFVMRERLSAAMAWMGALSVGLLFGMKVTGLLLAPPLLCMWGWRVMHAAWKTRHKGLLATAVVGAGGVVALGATTYIRNWIERHNVVWPSDLHVHTLGIDWNGPWPISNMQHAAANVWEDLFDLPKFDEQFADSRDNGYGNIAPFLILPLALVALLVLTWRNLARLVGTQARGRTTSNADTLLLAITAITLLAFSQSPAFWWARLNLHVIVVAFVLAAWLIGRGRWHATNELVTLLLNGIGLATLVMSSPRWDVDVDQMRQLAARTPEERISYELNHLVMPADTARAREDELGPGDVLAFTRHPFIGTLWNEAYSNRVVHVPYQGEAAFLAALESNHAKWAVVQNGSGESTALGRHPGEWQRIGFATAMNNETVAFRRVHAPPPRP